jgi:hypothetical protein
METKAFLLGGKLKHSGEIFHTADKKVWGQGIALSDSTLPQENPMNIPINCNRERSSGYTFHNKKDKMSWKAKVSKKVC